MNAARFKIRQFVENNTVEMISTLSKLVKIPSIRGEAEEGYPYGREPARALEKMLEIAEKMGFTVKNHENRVGTIDFYPEGEPTLGILCHLDVVPVSAGWKTPPFELTLKNGSLYGRGSIDNKGPAVSVLYAMYALKKLGVELSQNVRFIVGTDEECGSSDLAYYKNKEALPERLFTPDGSYPVINIEKGHIRGEISKSIVSSGSKTIVSLKGGTVTNAVPDTASAVVRGFEKNEILYAANKISEEVSFNIEIAEDTATITCNGKAAHASQPQGGANALTALIALLASLKTDDDTSAGFESLSKLLVFGEFDGSSLGIKMSDEKSGELTFVHSVASYNGEEFRGKFDIRFPISSNCDKIRQKIDKKLAKIGASLSEFDGSEPHAVDGDSDFVKALLSVYERVSGKRGYTIAIGGGTYVHNTNGVAFGAEFIGDKNNMHGANEKMSVELFQMNTVMFAEAILDLCS